ncbi:PepSY domain-containing protein [Devosia sp. A369]
MNPNVAFALVLVVALAVSPPGWAQGQGNGNGNANANANANVNAGLTAGAGLVTNGNQGGPANGAAIGAGQGGAPVAADQGGGAIEELSESEVLAAVEAGRAVSLSTILPDIRSRTGGEVINAQLQQVGAFLLYAVTVLTPAGKVATEYYYARSGLHVEN